MRFTHDYETGSFYLKLRKMHILKTVPVRFLGVCFLVDKSPKGKIVGIEYIHTPVLKNLYLKIKHSYLNAYHTARASFFRFL